MYVVTTRQAKRAPRPSRRGIKQRQKHCLTGAGRQPQRRCSPEVLITFDQGGNEGQINITVRYRKQRGDHTIMVSDKVNQAGKEV